MKVLITERLSKHRYKTPEGYLVCVDAILARTGKQVYKHNQVYEGSKDSVTDVEVDRKPEEVFSKEAIASFENKPITIEHPNEHVNSKNHKQFAVGFVRDVRRAKFGDREVLVGNAIITDDEAIKAIENGLDFLSCGYDCDITQTDNPEQINIRGNHVALCSNPRAGITMLQDSTDEVTIPHFIQVLTDALDSKQIDFIEDAIKYVVMCEQLYNGQPVKSRKPWSVFKTESREEAEKYVENKNKEEQSLVGFSKRYYLTK